MSNVLVYSGPGVSSSALQHTLATLRRLLPSYDVQAVDARALACDPWAATTALLVLPGGRDLPYVAELGEARRQAHAPASAAVRADERMHAYVAAGGRFLGICAGAYYASGQVVFQRGTPLEVVGERPALRFFPGECRGTAYPGFVYESDAGARLTRLALPDGSAWTCAYNGGGAFIDADAYASQGVEVLARYPPTDSALAPGYAGQAAALRCTVGDGVALLFGTHPEFPLQRDARSVRESGAPETVPPTEAELQQLDTERLVRLAGLLRDTGLEVSSPHAPPLDSARLSPWGVPRLTPLYWLSSIPGGMGELLSLQKSTASPASGDLRGLLAPDALDDTGALLSESLFMTKPDQNDTFLCYSGVGTSRSITKALAEADYSPYLEVVPSGAPGGSNGNEAEARAHDATEVNLHRVPKYVLCFPGVPDAAKGSLVATSSVLPDASLTPFFDIVAAMRYLVASREHLAHSALASLKPKAGYGGWPVEEAQERIGDTIIYGEVVTSTQTLLDKNPGFLKRAPSGLTIIATQQVSGRGRGKNAWISPRGCLQFSTVLELPVSCASGLVFVQYLAALAIVEAVRNGLGEAYAPVGRRLRIKWPNDVYAEVGSAEEQQGPRQRTGTFVHAGKRWAKLAGVLVNSSFSGGKEFRLVVGCGINCLNARPTTSISDVIALHNSTLAPGSPTLAPVSQEALAGAVLATLEKLWRVFLGGGGSFAPMRERYAAAWLHSDQQAALGDTVPPTPVRIVGVTSDHGTLRAVPLESDLTSESPGAWGASEGADAQRGPWIDLQPDGNSFSMLENLIRSKT